MDPEVLLLDEPTNGLDPRTQVWLIELLEELHRKGKTIISATHDLSIAGDIADRAMVFSEEHTLAADGAFGDIINNEELLLRVNLIHEHAHYHGNTAHAHRHGHFGHYHINGGTMHDTHKGQHAHAHGHGHEHPHEEAESLRKPGPCWSTGSNTATPMPRATGNGHKKASEAGEEEIAKEIYRAIDDNESVKSHLKRARAILAAKLVLRKECRHNQQGEREMKGS